MVDRNNLNRIKGILSARQGAEIPKFQNPAGPMLWNGQGDKEIKFHKKNRNSSIYGNNGKDWFQDIGLAIPYSGNLDGYVDATADTGVKPPLAIPGQDTDQGNPNAAVEAAAQVNAAADAQSNATAVTEIARRRIEALPPLPPLPIENKVTYNGLSAEEQFKEKAKEEVKERVSAGMKLKQEEEKKAKVINGIGNFASEAVQAIGGAVGQKQMASDSDVTKGITTAYDTAANIASNFGPVGQAVGTIMNIAKGAGDIIQELGGGTDQQTTIDKIMDSPLFSWNIGMLNGFAGKNSDEFGLDKDTLSKVGSSYGGTSVDLQETADKAGKKYGLFSSKKLKETNEAIAQARLKQGKMVSIADEATDDRLLVQSMGQQKGLANSIMFDGGYSQKYTYAAKQGGTLEWEPTILLEWEPQVELNWELPVFKEGGNIDIVEELEWTPNSENEKFSSFEEWFQSIPKKYRASGYDYKKAYEVLDLEVLRKHAKDPKNNHLQSASPVADENGNYPFLKLGKLEENPELQGEFNWYNSEDGKEHRSKFDIQFIGDRYYYVPKKLKKGGSVGDSEIPEIEETSQKNVIPEGALHKNKHHMEHAEGLTKKGIPVIDDEGEQQAEIEHSEIIFTLEVTKKLEEYYKIFYSDESSNKEKEQAAIDAGKLLVFQILENTEDRTGLIESCKKGGSLTLKTTTDDLIEEVLEWIPSVIIVEEKEPEEKPKKKEEKSDKELMKEAIKEVLIELLTK